MHRSILPALLIVVAIVASACGANQPAESAAASASDTASASEAASASSEASEEASAAEETASAEESGSASGEATLANDLEVGDCLNTDGAQVDEVMVVDCEQPHVFEAFHKYDLEGEDDAYPGDEAVKEDADAVCTPIFEEYVGTPYEESALYVTVIRPSESTWSDGDRTVICVLHEEDESEMTGSAEGSEQ